MAQTYSKLKLEEKAKDIFKNYPTAKVAFMTTDGYGFLDENRANLHSKSYKDGDYVEIENDDLIVLNKEQTVKKQSADELIEASKELDLEAAQKGLEIENDRKKPRTTVVAAYEERITELNTDK
jgi:hypothetical protein